jgi:DNA topoisomerase-1
VEGGDKPKRSSIPKGMSPASVDLERALKLLSLPREVAKHPESGQPILAGIGRFGPYVQHGKVYASLAPGDDVLEVGGNRAIDLIVTKEQGGGRGGRTVDPGRPIGDDPGTGKPIVVKAGRYGAYVTDGETNATIARDQAPETVTLAEALVLLEARRAAAPPKKARGRAAGPARAAKPAAAKKTAAAKPGAAKKPAAKTAATPAKTPAKAKKPGAAKPAAAKAGSAKSAAGATPALAAPATRKAAQS